MSEIYLVQELYNNPYEYSSANQKIGIVKAVCSSLSEAAEVVAKSKMQEIQTIIDQSHAGKSAIPLSHNLFITKAPMNTVVDILQLPRTNPTFADLSEETKKNFQAVLASEKELTGARAKIAISDATSEHLRVDPLIYVKDRRAREAELMRRANVAPMPAVTTRPAPVRTGGTIPQPAQPISVQVAGEVPSSLQPAAKTAEQPSTKAAQQLVSTFAVSDILPGLVSTGFPDATTVTGVVTTPPQGVATSVTSRVTQ